MLLLPLSAADASAGCLCAVALAPSAPAAALADSSATSQKKKMIGRQYSSGDHAYLPNPQQTAAKNLAARQGVQQGVQQDSEVSRSLASRVGLDR